MRVRENQRDDLLLYESLRASAWIDWRVSEESLWFWLIWSVRNQNQVRDVLTRKLSHHTTLTDAWGKEQLRTPQEVPHSWRIAWISTNSLNNILSIQLQCRLWYIIISREKNTEKTHCVDWIYKAFGVVLIIKGFIGAYSSGSLSLREQTIKLFDVRMVKFMRKFR